VADVLIALGGNVGDVRAKFQKAIANVCGMTQAALLARPSDFATPPWGDEQQARFINACIEIETGLDPHALLFTLHKIEKKFGRDRTSERRWVYNSDPAVPAQSANSASSTAVPPQNREGRDCSCVSCSRLVQRM